MWHVSLKRLKSASQEPLEHWLDLRWDRLTPAGGVALALAFATTWLLARPYRGITHDATLYLVQGLRRLSPEVFAQDLFFSHGSQDAYSLFTLVYAPMIEAMGPAQAALIMTAVGQVAFIAAAWMLAGRITSGGLRWWALALLASISGYYGGLGVFRIAEPFATARSLAEPMVVLALASLLADRTWPALTALAGAALLHPLVAAPGLAILILWHAMARKRLIRLSAIAAALGIAIALLAWPAALAPFDAPWREAVLERSPHLFLAEWEWADWARILWGLCIGAIALPYLGQNPRKLVLAAMAACVAGLAASALGVDLLDLAPLAALQLWRAHWPMHLLAILLVPVVVASLWRTDYRARVAAGCVLASLCFSRADLPAGALLTVLAVAIVYSRGGWSGWMTERRYRLCLLTLACIAAAGLMFSIQANLPSRYGAVQANSWRDCSLLAASLGVLLPLLATLGALAHSRFSASALMFAFAAFAAAVPAWDARSEWSRAIEQADPHPFRIVAPGAQVFWAAPSTPAWLVLQTRNWFSKDQGAGIVFNRETALEYTARRTASEALRIAIDNCEFVHEPLCRIDTRHARTLCRRSNGPDYLVLNGQVDAGALASWQGPGYAGTGPQKLYLYACRALARDTDGRSGSADFQDRRAAHPGDRN